MSTADSNKSPSGEVMASNTRTGPKPFINPRGSRHRTWSLVLHPVSVGRRLLDPGCQYENRQHDANEKQRRDISPQMSHVVTTAE
jgi:hypothetical protein